MKKNFRTNGIIAIALSAIFSVASAPAAYAGENPALPVELVFIGKIKSQPVFQLTVNGDAVQNDFSVIIRDESGNILFWEDIRSEKFSKKFLFNTDEIGDNVLQLEVYSKKTRKSVLYKISPDTRLNQEMAIYKLN